MTEEIPLHDIQHQLSLLCDTKVDHEAFLILENIFNCNSLSEDPSILEFFLSHDLSPLVSILDSNLEVSSNYILTIISEICQNIPMETLNQLFIRYFHHSQKPHVLTFKESLMHIIQTMKVNAYDPSLVLSYVSHHLQDLVDICWFSSYTNFVTSEALIRYYLEQNRIPESTIIDILCKSQNEDVSDEAVFRIFDVSVRILQTNPSNFSNLCTSELFTRASKDLIDSTNPDDLRKCNYIQLLGQIYSVTPAECIQWMRHCGIIDFFVGCIQNRFIDSNLLNAIYVLLGNICRSVEYKEILNQSDLLKALQEKVTSSGSHVSANVAFEVLCRLISCPLILQKLHEVHFMWLSNIITALARRLTSADSLTKPKMLECVSEMFSCTFVSMVPDSERKIAEEINWNTVFDARKRFLNILNQNPVKFLVQQVKNAIPEFQIAGFKLLEAICQNPWVLDIFKSESELLKVLIEHPIKGSLAQESLLLRYSSVKSVLSHKNAIRMIDSESFVKLRQISEAGPYYSYTITAPVQVETEAV